MTWQTVKIAKALIDPLNPSEDEAELGRNIRKWIPFNAAKWQVKSWMLSLTWWTARICVMGSVQYILLHLLVHSCCFYAVRNWCKAVLQSRVPGWGLFIFWNWPWGTEPSSQPAYSHLQPCHIQPPKASRAASDVHHWLYHITPSIPQSLTYIWTLKVLNSTDQKAQWSLSSIEWVLDEAPTTTKVWVQLYKDLIAHGHSPRDWTLRSSCRTQWTCPLVWQNHSMGICKKEQYL